MRDTGRDNADKKAKGQAKSALKGAEGSSLSLESRVAQYLAGQQKGVSLEAFSRELGIPRQSLSRYLNCSQSMTLGTLQKIATVMGVTGEEILGKKERQRKRTQ